MKGLKLIAILLQSISVVNFWSQGFSALVGWWMKGCSHRELNLFSSPNRLWVCSLVFKCVACQRQKQTNKRRMLHTVVMNKYKLGAKDAWAARKQPSHRSNENWQPTQVVRKSLTIHEWPCERVVCNGEICVEKSSIRITAVQLQSIWHTFSRCFNLLHLSKLCPDSQLSFENYLMTNLKLWSCLAQ